MQDYPNVIRLSRLSEIIGTSSEGWPDDPAPRALQVRRELARASVVATTSAEAATLDDDTLGDALTQKGLQDAMDRGYRTAYSQAAFPTHVLDQLHDTGDISDEQITQYLGDPHGTAELVTQFMTDYDVRVATVSGEVPYFVPREEE